MATWIASGNLVMDTRQATIPIYITNATFSSVSFFPEFAINRHLLVERRTTNAKLNKT